MTGPGMLPTRTLQQTCKLILCSCLVMSSARVCADVLQTAHMLLQGAHVRAGSCHSFKDLYHNACVCLTCSTASCLSESKLCVSNKHEQLKLWFSVCRHCWSTYRSGHGGSVRGDDDTCSLPTTTWSGQQARTPIAIRRLGPLQPAPAPHHQPPAKPRAWLAHVVKLAALGAVVAITATGVIKVSLLSCVTAHVSALSICLH